LGDYVKHKIIYLTLIIILISLAIAINWEVDEMPSNEPENVLTTSGKYTQEPIFGGLLYYYEVGP
jgi:hypothetical protein